MNPTKRTLKRRIDELEGGDGDDTSRFAATYDEESGTFYDIDGNVAEPSPEGRPIVYVPTDEEIDQILAGEKELP